MVEQPTSSLLFHYRPVRVSWISLKNTAVSQCPVHEPHDCPHQWPECLVHDSHLTVHTSRDTHCNAAGIAAAPQSCQSADTSWGIWRPHREESILESILGGLFRVGASVGLLATSEQMIVYTSYSSVKNALVRVIFQVLNK